MSVYKEAVHAINLIKKNTKRIYPDACDEGTPVRKGDEVWNWAKQLVEWYGVEGSRKVVKYSTGTTVSNRVRYMPNEHGSSVYKTVTLTYVTTRHDKDIDGYIILEEVK
jgi:hypothetical protein